MRAETLDLLRCPYCGGKLELVEGLPHRLAGGGIAEGLLGCHCCLFPVVAGIPVMHLRPEAVAAREAIEAGAPDSAFRTLIAPDDEGKGRRFQESAASPGATYRQLAEILGGDFEGEYFLYRFSDPSYVVASTAVAGIGAELLRDGGRAIDVCGGSGHLARLIATISSAPPVIADLYFAKLWLASRFVSPAAEPVCCDANAPLPFARGAFRLAICADAFMFIWTKRQLVSEMLRLTDAPGSTATMITHTHNELVWSHSHGQALPPEGYRHLFETVEPRLFAEGRLLDELVDTGSIDLSSSHAPELLEADPALTIVATNDESLLRNYPSSPVGQAPGSVLRINPLYEELREGEEGRFRLRFPSPEYEEEFGECRRYLPESLVIDSATRAAIEAGERTETVTDLVRRRIVLEMPEGYG